MGNSTVIRFSDPRRFGLVDLCKADGLEDHPLLARLGVEPLTDAFDGRCVARLLMGKNLHKERAPKSAYNCRSGKYLCVRGSLDGKVVAQSRSLYGQWDKG